MIADTSTPLPAGLPHRPDLPFVSVIVPALNEAENLPLLVPRVDAALRCAGHAYELIIVDDNSHDATPGVCETLAKTFPLKLIVRIEPKNGLSGAVLCGFEVAAGEVLVVMDADLQHPPEKLPELVAPLLDGSADFVLGSRHVTGAGTDENWGLFRRINSGVATLLARPFAGRVTDPMSGFFALSRETYARGQRLTPLGYKIGLELMCKCRVKRVKEIPIRFGLRVNGQSKLSIKQQFKYLEHLSRLYDFCYPRLSPVFKFAVATGLAWLIGLAMVLLFVNAGVDRAVAPALAYPTSIFTTAVFHLRYVRTQREFLSTHSPWRDFVLIALAEWSVCALAGMWLALRAPAVTVAELFVFSFGLATLVRYLLRKEMLQDLRGLRQYSRRDDSQ